jgi:tetratricopeptide (TPR) repeat protein
MLKTEAHLISLEIHKWVLEAERLHLRGIFIIDNQEYQNMTELSLTQPPDMVNEFMSKFVSEVDSKAGTGIIIANEGLIREKLGIYFKKILSELNHSKPRKGQARRISSTFFNVYNENQDLSFLPSNLQFYVLLNWARRYYEKDEFTLAIEPLRRLLKIRQDYGIVYKFLARSLKKIRKYDEAMRYYELYAKVEKSVEAKLDLAKSYRKGKQFEKSEKIYNDILKKEAKNKEARIGLVQIKYARMKEDYLPILDDLNQEDPDWLRKWLTEEFNFRIYNSPKTILPAIQAAQYLGYEKAYEITQQAFQNKVPSHFNPSKARMTFYKEELENWAEIINRYKIMQQQVELQPSKIKEYIKVESGSGPHSSDIKSLKQSGKPKNRSTRVEEIIRQIREERAKRNQYNSKFTGNSHIPDEQKTGQQSQSNSQQEPDNSGESKSKKGIDRKKIIAAKQTTKSASGNGQKKKRAKSKKKITTKTEEVNSV